LSSGRYFEAPFVLTATWSEGNATERSRAMCADMGFAQLAPVHLVANRRRNSRELVTLVGGQITALATDG